MLHYYHSYAIKYEQTEYVNVAYARFSDKWHDDIDDAYVYEMTCNYVEAKHLGCYSRGRMFV